MKKGIGLGLILIDIIVIVVLFIFIHHKGVYKNDFMALFLDSWEVIGLFIAILLFGLVLLLS